MGLDAISNAHVYVLHEDSSKKKKRNKMDKSRQNKIDLLREQCLIQVGNKEYKMETNKISGATHPSVRNRFDGSQKRGIPRRVRREKPEFLAIHNDESISWTNSVNDRKSTCNKPSNVISQSRNISSSSSSCSSCCSEEEKDKCCFDSWEGVADALNPDRYRPNLESENDSRVASFVSRDSRDGSKSVSKSRAWSPDDVFRPQSLPRISKQQINLIPVSAKDGSQDRTTFSWQNVVDREPQSRVCPICCEDLDVTDSSFIPCPCGFRLCLFCHNRVLEVDGRCPGCRKRYDSGNAGASLGSNFR
ncbi:hypothetical protein vseg_006593 [Gypsophila vaccaria]